MEGGYIFIMVEYPDLSSLNNGSGIAGLMALPNSSYPYFWGWILGGIWVIMVLTMYFKDLEKTGKSGMLSSVAVASFAIILLATIGTIVTFISLEIMVYTLVIGLLFIAVWFFSTR